MSKVLVTGCAGFIGSHICDHLLAAGHEVIGVDDLSGGFMENVPERVSFYERKVQDPGIEWVFAYYKPDIVIHAAAYAAEGLSHFIRRYNYENNLMGSVNLINLAVNYEVKCFVFLSSIGVYGHGSLPFREDQIPDPIDPYGVAKYAVEMDLASAGDMFGLEHMIFRPHNVYGPRQNCGDPYRNVVGIFMRQCMNKEPMTIFGDGEQTRAFSFIDDVARPIAAAVDRPHAWNQIVNVGGGEPTTVDALARMVSKAIGGMPLVTYLPERNEVKDTHCDHQRAYDYFGDVMPRVSLEDGLERMAAWVLAHGARVGERFKNIEIEKNLPPSWAAMREEMVAR